MAENKEKVDYRIAEEEYEYRAMMESCRRWQQKKDLRKARLLKIKAKLGLSSNKQK